jgi:hypothetical protein
MPGIVAHFGGRGSRSLESASAFSHQQSSIRISATSLNCQRSSFHVESKRVFLSKPTMVVQFCVQKDCLMIQRA